MTYKFFVKMDGEVYGPYSVKELMELGLLDDTLLTEESMNGEWLPAKKFDFDDMLKKEQGDVHVAVPDVSQNTSESARMVHSNIDVNNVGSTSPSIIGKWSWGAFALNWIWGIFNGVYWPLLLILVNIIPKVGWIVSLIVCVFLGIKGNELAWNGKKKWLSVAEFENTQRKWATAAIVVLGIAVILGLLIGFASV